MSPAYKNLGLRVKSLNLNNPIEKPQSYFTPGDELYLKRTSSQNGNGIKGWVTEVNKDAKKIKIVDKDGKEIPKDTYDITIVRSGRRNQQATPIGTVTTLLDNPIETGKLNFNGVRILNAGAVEFNSQWGEDICAHENKGGNPYITGEEGNFRPQRSFVYLTGRTRLNKNRNTNIREDGVFTSFSPFWNPRKDFKWAIDSTGWTFASEVTMFSPYGFELENRDALGRYTSASYGYNNTLPTAISANSQYREMGFSGFEDVEMNKYKDDHFGIDYSEYKKQQDFNINTEQSHTGRYSIEVKKGKRVGMERILRECE
jgi:hypothetical protein